MCMFAELTVQVLACGSSVCFLLFTMSTPWQDRQWGCASWDREWWDHGWWDREWWDHGWQLESEQHGDATERSVDLHHAVAAHPAVTAPPLPTNITGQSDEANRDDAAEEAARYVQRDVPEEADAAAWYADPEMAPKTPDDYGEAATGSARRGKRKCQVQVQDNVGVGAAGQEASDNQAEHDDEANNDDAADEANNDGAAEEAAPAGGDNFLMMMIRRQMRLRELRKEDEEADDRASASSGP